MPETTTHLLIAAVLVYAVLILFDFLRADKRRVAVIELLLLAAATLFLNRSTGFPTVRVPFGDASVVLTVVLMFICTTLGIAANYLFYRGEAFSWQSFLKPLLVTPIVLLPLLGSIQAVVHLEWLQTVSFALLAFQNGFFWNAVFDSVSKRLVSRRRGPSSDKAGSSRGT